MTEFEADERDDSRRLLTDEEIESLADQLWAREEAMTLEEVDGLFCALIAAPELVPPSVYLRAVFSGSADGESAVPAVDPATAKLLMRYWNSIVADFHGPDGVHVGHVEEPGTDGITGRDWARAYLYGTRLSGEGWEDFFEEDNESGALSIPIVAGEVDADWPKSPLSEDENDDLLCSMFAAAAFAYDYFAADRTETANAVIQVLRTGPKVGRNDPCPCNSGRKYKKCCGAAAEPASGEPGR